MTTDVAETTNVSPASETDSPRSDDALLPVSDATSTEVGGEQVERAEDATPSAQETETNAVDWSDQDLWQRQAELKRADFDPVDWLKINGRLDRLHQSVADQQKYRAEARAQAKANEERINELGAQLPDRLHEAVQAEIASAETEMRPVSPTLLKALVDKESTAVMNEIEPLVLIPWAASVKADILRRAGPDLGAQLVNSLEGQPYHTVINAYGDLRQRIGEMSSPAGKEVAGLREQVEKLKAENLKLDGQLKGGGGSSTAGRESTARNITYEQLVKMTPAQIEALPEGTVSKVVYGT